MRFAGGLVKHLGLQMYSGAVPSIAELIANAWDADAHSVEVSIPLDEAMADGLEVAVRDDGAGMSFEEVENRYLVLGFNRRQSFGQYSPGGRKVLGRKGIGKLAGFGIARLIEVWTVHEGHLTAFQLDYDAITKDETAAAGDPYEPPVLADRPVQPGDPLQQGTLVRLRRLQLKNAINGQRFRRSMVRRFSLLSAEFCVAVNGETLERQELDVQFRFPRDSGVNAEDVAGMGRISWWAGFTKKPIAVEEARGVAVLAHGKLVQAPFFFELSGGVQGQHGMQYLTGEVHADLLDEEVDLVATDRASVLWEDPRALPLLHWGQAKVKELLREWSRLRFEDNKKKLRDTTPLMAMVERFPEREQKELVAAINTLAGIETITDERLEELVRILIRAYENDQFMSVIRALNAADETAHDDIVRLVEEWDVLEAVATAQKVRGRVEIIRTFGRLIAQGAPEKPDMQDFLKTHTWLLNPAWEMLQHERSLDRVIAEEFDAQPTGEGRTRLDYFCIADSGLAVVVELKRPGLLVGLEELGQLERYVDFLRSWNERATGSRRPYARVLGCLVYSRMRQNADLKVRRLAADDIEVQTWRQLLQTTERLHRDFLEVVKARAPQDDPRIEALNDEDLDPMA